MNCVITGVLISFSILGLVSGADKVVIKKCQVCSYLNHAKSSTPQGDKDCMANPGASKFNKACGQVKDGLHWSCGTAEHKEGDIFMYERKCYTEEDCATKQANFVVDGKNKKVSWKCCHDKDNCNASTQVSGSVGGFFALSIVITMLARWMEY